MNREMKRLLQRQGQLGPDGAPAAPSRDRAASAAQRARAPERAERPSFPRRAADYLHEVRVELAKVAWPGRTEVLKYTVVVFCTVVLLTAVVFGLDALFAKAVLILFGH